MLYKVSDKEGYGLKKQRDNTIWAIINYIVMIISGLIIPRAILSHYGSEMNGLVHSITQFLSYSVLLEMGIGAVIPSALYFPLSKKDDNKISAVFSSGYKVYRKIALICVFYIAVLGFLFPKISGISVSALFVLVLGLGTVFQYLIGEPERLLLISDQKGYVFYGIKTVAIALKTVLQVIFIKIGYSLVIVVLIEVILHICQIAFVFIYARTHYKIDRKVKYEKEPIAQKWNGVAQHIAFFVLENTDIVLLTLFTSFREVSVYSVYFLVISGVRRMLIAVNNSIQPALGNLWAKNDREELRKFFDKYERWIHISAVLAFGIMGVLLIPFIKAYTEGVNDVNYIRPIFAVLMVTAYGFQSFRDPYDKLILASGHFKQTQINYIIAASLNLGISLAAVNFFGLEGVALGTMAAMLYQMIYMMVYDSKVLLKRSMWIIVKRLVIDALILILIIFVSRLLFFRAEELFKLIFSFLKLL